ncbi:MAG: TonB-dependent receptor [Chitinophagaceae bacterium]
MKQALLLLCLFVSTICVRANDEETTGKIEGTILTSDGNSASDVSVQIKGTSKGTSTDKDGKFAFTHLKPGSYTLLISFLGYDNIEETVLIESGKTASVTIKLKASNKELTEVIVTSNKKYRTPTVSSSLRLTTPILEVPQNIQVITKGLLADQQTFDMLDGVQRNVSGAQRLEHWDNYALINMRGSQVTAFRNGMNVQMPWGPLSEDMSMVERIEFVKGPAGFMLANGEPSGLYNVVTKKPSGYTKGEASFSLGSFDTYRATLDLDGKLTKDGKLLYRLNVMGQQKGSHRDYEYNNRYSIVPVLKYLVDDNTSLTLEYTHQFSQMNVIGSNYAFSKKGYADLPVNFTTAEPNMSPTNITDQSILAIFEHKFSDNWKFTAQASYQHYKQIGQSLWPSAFAPGNDSLIQRGVSIWDALGINKSGQMFLTGKVVTGPIVHKILGGVDLYNKDYYADFSQGAALGGLFNIYAPVYGTVSAADMPQWDRSKDIRERGVRYNTSSSSFYVQDELGFFNDKLRLTLAGRYTNIKQIDPYSGSINDKKFTPRVGVSYSITKDFAGYFVYDQSFIANYGSDWQNKPFDPQHGNSLEAGLKKDWFNGQWSSTVAVYKIIRNNVLTTDTEHPNPANGQYTYSRVSGQQETKGVEIDIKGEIIKNLELVANYAFTQAEITKDSDPKVVGNQVPGASKHIVNTWLSYKIGRGVLNGLKFSGGYTYQAGRSSWYVFDNTENGLPDYIRFDGAISYSAGKYLINFNVNNLANRYLFSGAPYSYGGFYYWQAEAKRNCRVTVAYRF